MAQPKAYSYIRFSTPNQEKGGSYQRQFEASRAYAVAHGLELDESLDLTDRGISAFHGLHKTKGALGRFLKLIELGQIASGSALIVENLDRLSREPPVDALGTILDIVKAGITLVIAEKKREYTKDSLNANIGELVEIIVETFRAHGESDRKESLLKTTLATKRNLIRNNSDRKFTARCPAWLKLTPDLKVGERRSNIDSKFIPIPRVVAVINQIFEMRLNAKGTKRIETELNRLDVWKPKNGWRKSYIKKILSNREVLGEYQPHMMVDGKRVPACDGDGNTIPPIPNYFGEGIVKEEVFNRVQEMIKHNRETEGQGGGQNGVFNNLFRHLVKCGDCWGPMHYDDKGPNDGGGYLICDWARRGVVKRGVKCKNKKTYLYDKLESMILTYCRELDVSSIMPGNQQRISELSVLRNQLQGKEGELDRLQKQIKNLTEEIADTEDQPTRKSYRITLTSKLGSKEALKSEMKDLSDKIHKLTTSEEAQSGHLKSLQELVDRMHELKGQDRIDLRLNLQGQLRRLLHVIRIFGSQDVELIFETALARRIYMGPDGKIEVGNTQGFFPYNEL